MEKVNETSSLIAGGKVSGTNVFNTTGDNIGEIDDVMIDKRSGKVAYAVMSFGGFLGIGQDYHPLPWQLLKYDTNLGGYVVNVGRDELEKAPVYPKSEWGDRAVETKLHDYYGVGPYWMM